MKRSFKEYLTLKISRIAIYGLDFIRDFAFFLGDKIALLLTGYSVYALLEERSDLKEALFIDTLKRNDDDLLQYFVSTDKN